MPTIAYDTLRKTVAEIFLRAGLPTSDADLTAEWLVDTEARGVTSHGIARIGMYVSALQRGKINPTPNVTIETKRPTVALVDGDNGMGSVVGAKAMASAVDLAQTYGVGVASVRNSNHYGMASHFLRVAAEANCVGLTCSNSSPAMSVWGGRDALLGTNPLAICFPAPGRRPHLTIDMASSTAALGKIRVAQKEGRKIPTDWALSSEGTPTSDPTSALAGVLLPFGGAKGSALALAIECFAGILSGSAFATDVGNPNDASATPTDVGHMFMAFDISAFMDLDAYFRRMEALRNTISHSRPAFGFEDVRVPGEHSEMQRRQAKTLGIALTDAGYAMLVSQAEQLGLAAPI